MDQISFRTAQAAPAIQTKTKEMQSEQKNGNNNQVENGNEKLILALSGLAAIGTAAIAFKTGKAHKAKKALNEAAQHAQAQARDIAQKAANEEATKKAVKFVQSELSENANYALTKKAGKFNLTHNGKKVVQEALNEQKNNIRTNEAVIKKATTEAMETAQKGATTAETARQGMKNALPKERRAQVLKAYDAEDKAREAAENMKKIAEENPTRKNIKRATHANNQAIKAEKEAEETARKSSEIAKKQRVESKTKAANIAQQQASPHYEDGLIKQMINADKTTSKEVNALKKAMKTPAWANAEKRLSKMTPEQLKGVIANPKSSNIEVKVAKYLLG